MIEGNHQTNILILGELDGLVQTGGKQHAIVEHLETGHSLIMLLNRLLVSIHVIGFDLTAAQTNKEFLAIHLPGHAEDRLLILELHFLLNLIIHIDFVKLDLSIPASTGKDPSILHGGPGDAGDRVGRTILRIL